MRIAYFDCRWGASGDMCVAALLGAGAEFSALQKELRKIPLSGYSLSASSVKRMGLAAMKFDVKIKGETKTKTKTKKPPLGWAQMRHLIARSTLHDGLKEKGLGIIKTIFEAEAEAHGARSVEDVHLHEMGSADTVVDVMATLICLRTLGVRRVYASPVNLGGGSVKSAHGMLPVPAPATALLIKNMAVYSSGIPHELLTPTGAALMGGLCSGFGPMPPMRLTHTGTGAGERELKEGPNTLRVFIGEALENAPEEEITVLETNIDDMNPQVYEYLLTRLLKAGALDAFLTPVIMKKTRPAVKLSVLCREKDSPGLKEIIFRETTTLGIRHYRAGRTTLRRKIERLSTEFGPVRFKTSFGEGGEGGNILRSAPEYEDCLMIAKKTGLPLKDVIERLNKTPKKPPPSDK